MKTLKEGVTIRAGETIDIPCKISSSYMERRTPVLFQPHVEFELEGDLMMEDEMIFLKKGNRSRVSITATNSSKHDIFIPGRTTVGELHMVSSVIPLEVKLNGEVTAQMFGVNEINCNIYIS